MRISGRRLSIRLAAGLAFLVVSAASASSFASARTDWEAFRKAYPYHGQLIAFGPPGVDGSRTIVLSEPPPWITLKDLTTRYGHIIKKPAIQTHRVGFDGWVKDVVGSVELASDDARLELVEDLSRDFFGTSYKAFAVDILPPTTPGGSFDLSVGSASMRSWLGLGLPHRSGAATAAHWFAWIISVFCGIALLRRRTKGAFVSFALALLVAYLTIASPPAPTAGSLEPIHGGRPVQLRTLLAGAPQAGVYLSQATGIVVLVVPKAVPLNDAAVPLREFSLESDLIIGGVASDSALAIVGRERQMPVTMMPPLRVESLLQLAAASTEELAQSYERRRLFAGPTGEGNADWAPIYLSPQLHDSEYGSLLNITDQLLKSWSEHGEVDYINFSYAKPSRYPFATGLLEHAQAKMVTYNWNTKGLGYSDVRDGWDVLSFTRTGALPVDYLGEQDARMRTFEDQAYEFFAGTTRDPNLARVVQYAGMYQIFRHFGVQAKWSPSARPHGGPDALQPLARRFLDILREVDPISLFEEAGGDPKLAEELKKLQSIRGALIEIGRDDNEPSLDSVARALVKPRDFNPATATRAEKIAYGVAEAASGNSLVRMLAWQLAATAARRYIAAESSDPTGWIKTPSIVLSRQTGKHAGIATGGHNLSSRISRVEVDDNLAPGAVRVVETSGGRTLYYNAADRAKIHDVVRSFARNQDKAPSELTGVVESELRKARLSPTALPDALKLSSRAPELGRGLVASSGVRVSTASPWRYAGEIPSSHAAVLEALKAPTVLPIVVEHTKGTYLVSTGGQTGVIEAASAAGARDAVVAAVRQAGDHTVHLHFVGMEAERAAAFSRVTEIHAVGKKGVRLRTSVNGSDSGTLKSLGELRNGSWKVARADVRSDMSVLGQIRNKVEVDVLIPAERGPNSLRMRVSIKLRQSIRLTKEFLEQIAEAVGTMLRRASEAGADLDVLLASRRMIASLRLENESIESVHIRIAVQAGEVDVVRSHVETQIVAGE